MKVPEHETGFTIVEVIVTLAITSLFLTFFFMMFLTMESQRIAVARQALASDIAYSNLRKFTNAATLAALQCTTNMDLTLPNPDQKQGELVGSQADEVTANSFGFLAEPSAITKQLGTGASQSIRAFAPKGCTGTTINSGLIKVESTVTYGTNGKVVHASYVN